MGFFDTVSDLFGGGSEYTPDGGSSANRSSNYSYSDLGGSPGAMGGRTDNTSSYSPPSYSDLGQSPGAMGGTSVPEVNPAMDFLNNYTNNLTTLMGGGSSADVSAVSVDDSDSFSTEDALRRGASALNASNAPDFVTMVGGTSSPDTRPRPDPNEIRDTPQLGGAASDRPDPNEIANLGMPNFVFDYIPGISPFESNTDTMTENYMREAYGTQQQSDSPASVSASDQALAKLKDPKSTQDFSFRSYVGNIFKDLGAGAKSLGDFISNLSASDALKYFQDFLRGDPNFKGPSPTQQQLMGVPGPGPAVGGGAPSPGGSGGGGSQMPSEKVMQKDPCPPGFKFDPILNQCMPMIKSAPKPPPMPTPISPESNVGGGIADVYPFTLTPPVGKPIGTLPPIQFAPK